MIRIPGTWYETRLMIRRITRYQVSMIRIPGTEVQSSPVFHPQSENLLRGSKPCQVLLWGDFGKLKSPTMKESWNWPKANVKLSHHNWKWVRPILGLGHVHIQLGALAYVQQYWGLWMWCVQCCWGCWSMIKVDVIMSNHLQAVFITALEQANATHLDANHGWQLSHSDCDCPPEGTSLLLSVLSSLQAVAAKTEVRQPVAGRRGCPWRRSSWLHPPRGRPPAWPPPTPCQGGAQPGESLTSWAKQPLAGKEATSLISRNLVNHLFLQHTQQEWTFVLP